MDQVQNMELSKDQIIQELIALLNQNQQKEAANDVFERLAKEPERIKDMDKTGESILGYGVEQKFQYGAEAFETQTRERGARMVENQARTDTTIKKRNSR